MERENCYITPTGKVVLNESLRDDWLDYWLVPIGTKMFTQLPKPKIILRDGYNDDIARRMGRTRNTSTQTRNFAQIYADLGHPSEIKKREEKANEWIYLDEEKMKSQKKKKITFAEIYAVLGKPKQ